MSIHERALTAVNAGLEARGYWLSAEAKVAVVNAIADVIEAELDAAQRRTVAFVERLDDARVWARANLPAEQQHQLLAILGGREARP